jgi:hypothetical protein
MYGDGVLQTADAAAVRAGANVLLLENGRVISFINATQTGSNTYQISGIKDGRLGSDAGLSAETAVSGAKVLLLLNHDKNTEGSVMWKQTDFESYNKAVDSTFFPSGHQGDAGLTTTINHTFTADNLKPLAPVNVRCVRGGDGSATFTGRLRTRIADDGAWDTSSPGTMTDSVNGGYKISINLNNGVSTVRKNFTVSDVEFSITISAATLTSAFGSLPATLTGTVLMTNSLVGDGRPRAFTES